MTRLMSRAVRLLKASSDTHWGKTFTIVLTVVATIRLLQVRACMLQDRDQDYLQ